MYSIDKEGHVRVECVSTPSGEPVINYAGMCVCRRVVGAWRLEKGRIEDVVVMEKKDAVARNDDHS